MRMFRPSEHSPRDPRRARDGRGRMNAGHGRPGPFSQRPAVAPADVSPVRGAWLVAPMLLLALASILRLAVRGPDPSFAICFASLLGLGVVWVAIGLWLPAPHPPPCPHCKRAALVRLEPSRECGARCLHCGWRDEAMDASRLGRPAVLEPLLRGSVRPGGTALHPRETRHDPR